ncbi:nitrilase-related carbon-nitrogen hydrolase [Microbacterium indicum]|uniref:nitrilase-related carbon-nitrogen hydrolase n=1 Tax=Microbacterium indicum TaxID=358100 RepID=UPI0004002047|nr:nitrilase-related carbon-nitrogen hydrolase [Microbacterium indicum]
MAASPVGIAVAQFVPSDDRDANLRAIERAAADAAGRGARVVVAPEYASFFVAPFDERMRENAEELDGPFARRLRAIAAEHGVVVVAGLVALAEAPLVRNVVVAVDGTGVVATSPKQHLYDAFGQRESEWFARTPLGDPQLVDVDGLRLGMMTCYDLRFPEVARTLVDAGADAILVPSEWVRGPQKEHHWQTLLAARAIENTVYVAAADHAPPIGVGLSAVIDPRGTTLAGLGGETGVAVAWASRERIDEVRAANPALALRRYRVEPSD